MRHHRGGRDTAHDGGGVDPSRTGQHRGGSAQGRDYLARCGASVRVATECRGDRLGAGEDGQLDLRLEGLGDRAGAGAEGRLARRGVGQRRGPRPVVGAHARLLAVDDLGRHVSRGAGDQAVAREAVVGLAVRQPKVDQDRAVGPHHDVRRRHVTVNDARVVGRRERRRRTGGEVREVRLAHRPVVLHVVPQALAGDVLEDHERFVGVEFGVQDRGHRGVLEGL